MKNKNKENLRFRRFLSFSIVFLLFGIVIFQGVDLVSNDHGKKVRVDIITQNLEIYKKNKGEYPDNLQALSDVGLIDPVPVDQATGEPFEYKAIEKDGKRVDFELKYFRSVGQRKETVNSKNL